MNIETKFNIGEEIFFLHERAMVKSVVRQIKIDVIEGNVNVVSPVHGIGITYLCNKDLTEKSIYLKVEERHAFKSKEDLIASL